ncbi:unnamed protein product [Nezara viridula]|uniref:Uncharacterized protein n=1 Tax=Nezara viridula TaxID=85310 RepID=A0A9P0GXC6_NEZVI|nr:unnamed protein product [Nezara viridula]
MLILAGKPMYFLELAVGQFSGVGPLALWNCCPIAKVIDMFCDYSGAMRINIVLEYVWDNAGGKTDLQRMWLSLNQVYQLYYYLFNAVECNEYLNIRVGCAMITVSLIVCIYYNVIMSYTVFYMVASFDSEVPWSKCDPAWADMATCYVRGEPQSLVSDHNLY